MCKILIYKNKFEIFKNIQNILKVKTMNEKILKNHKCDV